MKVKELIELLRDSNKEHQVVIGLTNGTYLGQKPYVGIVHTYQGFDHDYGFTYLVGNLDISTVSTLRSDLLQQVIEEARDIGNHWFKTHFTPEDEEVGMFEGIQEHMSQEEFNKCLTSLLNKMQDAPCSTCRGYGLWGMGDPSPVGPIDSSDGMPTIECPECKANANPC